MSSFNKKSIKAETAFVAIQGAVAKAHQLGHKMSIVISDESGALKSSYRMDGASDSTLQIGGDKAYTSA